MQLGLFTQPVQRLGRDYADALARDRELFILADQLGCTEAFCGGHLVDQVESTPNSLMFLASLVDSTKTMKLAPGVLNLPFTHPVAIAASVAMLDNMLRGRLLLGIGSEAGPADAEILELLDEERNAMLEEAIEQVVALWTGEAPHGLAGEHWGIPAERVIWPEFELGSAVRPFQKPHPPILGMSADAGSQQVSSFGRRGWPLMSSGAVPANLLARQWDTYAAGCLEGGREADRRHWRVVRSTFVCDDEKKARFYGTVEKCAIAGGVSQVTEEILALRAEAGPFGTLVYSAGNWTDPKLSRRSIELMAEEVMPAVNSAIAGEQVKTPWQAQCNQHSVTGAK